MHSFTAHLIRIGIASTVVVGTLAIFGCTPAQEAKITAAGKSVQTAVVAAAPVVFKTVCDNYPVLDLVFNAANTDPLKAHDEQIAIASLKTVCDNPPKDLNTAIADVVRVYMGVKLASAATAASPAPTVAVAPAPSI